MKIKFEEFLNESKLSKIVKRYEYNGYEILVGRNAESNDLLTFEISDPNDTWLHVSGVPGSHVIIKDKGEEIPKEVIEYAAQLTADNSKSPNGKVRVVYCKRKNVKKGNEHKTGQVSVDYGNSNFINVYKKEK